MTRPAIQAWIGEDIITDLAQSELRYRSPHGREDRIIFYCRDCSYQTRPEPYPLQEIRDRHCPKCEGGMSFVAYEQGIEDTAAKRLIDTGELPND